VPRRCLTARVRCSPHQFRIQSQTWSTLSQNALYGIIAGRLFAFRPPIAPFAALPAICVGNVSTFDPRRTTMLRRSNVPQALATSSRHFEHRVDERVKSGSEVAHERVMRRLGTRLLRWSSLSSDRHILIHRAPSFVVGRPSWGSLSCLSYCIDQSLTAALPECVHDGDLPRR
jgi:hypothetical protein